MRPFIWTMGVLMLVGAIGCALRVNKPRQSNPATDILGTCVNAALAAWAFYLLGGQ